MTDAPDELRLLVRVMGVTVAIDTPDVETRDRLARQWSRALDHHSDELPVGSVLAAATDPQFSEASRDYTLTTEVTMRALQATVGRRFNFHAGGLADDRGRVLALVAPSGTGKTTATRLLSSRLGYLSDETVSMTPDGRVYAHPKPLSVLLDGDRKFEKVQLSPDDLGLLPTPDTGRLARFVVLRRGVKKPRGLVQLPPAEGALELIEQSSSLGMVPDPLTSLLGLMEGSGGVWALEYDEITDHVDTLVELLARELPAAGGPIPVRHPGRTAHEAVPRDSLGRLDWVDAVELDDELLVLMDERAVRVDNLGATIWLVLATPHTLDELVAAVQEVHGDHPDAHALVERTVEVLIEERLVARGTLA